jgi:quercetin dioxygenase-like cupin family protein
MTKPLLPVAGYLLAALAAAPLALAQDAPRAWDASPAIYKVIAESETHRIILVTWKPGQRDEFHSHAAGMGAYYVTDCKLSGRTPEGKPTVGERKAGQARFRPKPTKSHSVENVGSAECRIVLFEPK